MRSWGDSMGGAGGGLAGTTSTDVLQQLRGGTPSGGGGLHHHHHHAASSPHLAHSASMGHGHHGGGDQVQAVMASELESLRAQLRAKTGELTAAQQLVVELEATRDRCGNAGFGVRGEWAMQYRVLQEMQQSWI